MTGQDREPRVSLIGAPADIGAAHPGCSMGPEALRVAGIVPALRRLGVDVHDAGNLAGPVDRDAPSRGGPGYFEQVAAWCRLAQDGCAAALADGRVPVLLGGDHSLAVGSVAAAARHARARGAAFWLLWLDAHADFNTPETSPSGNVHGMPAAAIAGLGDPAFTGLGDATPMVPAGRIVQLGVRDVDDVEKELVVEAGVVVRDMRTIDERQMRDVVAEVLDMVAADGGDAHLHVSFDIDFLDPTVAPGVSMPVPGGPTYREAQLCMEMIHDSGLMRSLDILELNPALDERNRTAEVTVDLVESLFGRQILARPRG